MTQEGVDHVRMVAMRTGDRKSPRKSKPTEIQCIWEPYFIMFGGGTVVVLTSAGWWESLRVHGWLGGLSV